MDGFKQIGKYLKKSNRATDLSLKRPVLPEISTERIRDIFDSTHPVKALFKTPSAAKKVTMDINFGRKLPSIGCCGDCMCGITESYTGDSMVNGSIYVTQAYVPESTVVYLDGVRATKGVDYVEANPETGQIAILLPNIDALVISYVYTVGNCTEAICIDERFECLGYTFLSGLVTVFSDRFDRPAESDPSGGCGYYFSTALAARPKTFPLIFGGEAIISSTTATWVGGADRLIGKSVEILTAINIDNMSTGGSGNIIQLVGHTSDYLATFSLIKTSDTVLTLRISARIRQWMVFDDPFSSIDLTSFDIAGFTLETTIPNEGGRYWFRVAQLNGSWVAKAWPQFTAEPSTQLTAQLSDSFAAVPIDTTPPNIEVNRDLIQPTVNYIRFPGAGWEAIQVGAGLDNGDWEQLPTAIGSTSESAHGHYCAEIPDGLVRFGYNCFPFNGGSEVIYGNNSLETQWVYSYPHFTSTDGSLGRIVEYSQHVISIKTGLNVGHPGGVRLKGQISGSIWANPVTVQVLRYPTGPLTMGGINGIQGGQVVGSFLVGTDGTQKQDVDIFIPTSPGEEYVRVGMHVPNLSQLAMQQPFYSAPFLSANNVTSVVFFYFLRAEAVQSVQCNAAPFCNNCANNRCPPVQDNFTTDTDTQDFGTTDFYRSPNSGLKVFHDKGTGAKVEYIGGTEKVSFNNSATALQSSQYPSPFDCAYTEDTTSAWEATFDVRLTAPAAAEASSFEFGGWDGGPYIRTQWDSGGIDFVGSFNISPTYGSTNLTIGPWYSVKYRLESLNFFLKIWLAGTTEPSSWDFTATATSHTRTFATYTDATWASGTSSFTSEIRNLVINKVV